MNVIRIGLLSIGIFSAASFAGCGHRYYAGPLRPAPEVEGMSGMTVSDDGTETFVKERLEIGVRPVTDEELNRQFAAASKGGLKSTNPYTYGEWVDPETSEVPQRFTVFSFKVKNYTYPKVQVDPMKAVLLADNGRVYRPLSMLDLEEYYTALVTGYAGNAYARYEARRDIMMQTRFIGDVLFSGQEQEGFVVFPTLHHDVGRLRLRLEDVVLRFDYRDEPMETMDVEYLFQREIGRIYPSKEAR